MSKGAIAARAANRSTVAIAGYRCERCKAEIAHEVVDGARVGTPAQGRKRARPSLSDLIHDAEREARTEHLKKCPGPVVAFSSVVRRGV